VLQRDGADAALDLLEALALGPNAEELYPPLFPALLGPEAIRTERARQVQRLVNRTR
jgi:hypothetical protein